MTEHEHTLPEPQPSAKGVRGLLRRRNWPKGSGPAWPILVAIAAVFTLGIGGLLAAGIAGIGDGFDLRRAQKATAVAQHYNRGLQHLEGGELVLAQAEFARVMELSPQHLAARTRLEALTRAIEATARPSPSPIPTATPQPTATPSVASPDPAPLLVLLEDAHSLMSEAQWSEAVLRLEQLRAIAPEFESQEVESLLFDCHMAEAEDLIAENHLEAALRSFDKAIALRPEDQIASEERSLLVLYSQGIGTMGAEWEAAIFALNQLYERRPDYLDVAERLHESHSDYARALMKREEWCIAANHLQAAQDLFADEATAELLAEAQAKCQ